MFFVFFFSSFFFSLFFFFFWLTGCHMSIAKAKRREKREKKNENTTDEFAYIIAPFLSSPPVTLHRHTGSGEI